MDYFTNDFGLRVSLFEKADIRRVSLSFIRCYGLVELCVEVFFNGQNLRLII